MPDFADIIAARPADRYDLFLAAAARLGTAVQNVEKDFWVCWTLDVLFNRRPPAGPRLLFKGGTSLSKSFGLIDRFSEDIDVTVFRDDLGVAASVDSLETLGTNARQRQLDAIKAACQTFIAGDLQAALAASLAASGAGQADSGRVELDPDDADRQSLLLWYPASVPAGDGYIRPAVKIESGAKSALDPHASATVRPYVAEEMPHLDLTVPNVTTVEAERTFWDKVIILHGQRRWYERRGSLHRGGERVSRHYYDIHRLMAAPTAARALAAPELGRDCTRHAQLFFSRRDYDLASATPGSFALMPSASMRRALAKDYRAMIGMIFGDVPALEQILDSVRELEVTLNKAP